MGCCTSAKPQIIMVRRAGEYITMAIVAHVFLEDQRQQENLGSTLALAPKEESFTERQCIPGNSNLNYTRGNCQRQPKDESARERKI